MGGEMKPYFFGYCLHITLSWISKNIPGHSLPKKLICVFGYFNQLIRIHISHMGHILVSHCTIKVSISKEKRKRATTMVTCEHTDPAVWLIEKCVTILPRPGPPPLSDPLVVHSGLIHPSCFGLCRFCNLGPINSSHSTPLFIFTTMASYKYQYGIVFLLEEIDSLSTNWFLSVNCNPCNPVWSDRNWQFIQIWTVCSSERNSILLVPYSA